MRSPILLMSAVLLTAGCAKSSNDVQATYVSPLQYHSYDCQQIGAEAQRVSQRLMVATGQQDKKASNDAVAMGAALLVFAPAVLFIGGNDQTSYELSQLKGELDTLQKVSVEKKCDIKFETVPPAKPAAAAKIQGPKS